MKDSPALEHDEALSGPVADGFLERMLREEDARLASWATRTVDSLGLAHPEEACRLRMPYQRDRDRIVHSKAFRRLKHKTQVFIAPEGDHFRTRLTHTLEVTGIARAVARALGLNEDLTEAIALGHDLGHPPFGHTGEEALSDALEERTGRRFHHNEHSLRMVEDLERDGRGLNLTDEVRDGILNHTGPTAPRTPEGRIVKLVDRFGYINHDIDDAVRAGVLDPARLPPGPVELLGPTAARRIDALVHDLVEESARVEDIRQTETYAAALLELRAFMFDEVYMRPETDTERARIRNVVQSLFAWYLEHPDEVPTGDAPLETRVVDHVAGMTDRYALRAYRERFEPSAWRF
ncbi:MAG: deoxyguanosinetriphosphate triphosphohydrolase [Gaiellales bacterium]